MDENKCLLCNGFGFIQELDDNEGWEDARCPECGGSGIDEDEEGK